jgi:hypothetical protein
MDRRFEHSGGLPAAPGSKVGELTAQFDVVLGRTAQDLDNGLPRGIGDPEGQPAEPGASVR